MKEMKVYQIEDIGATLSANAYVGRGIIIGKSADGKKAVTAYFIMGRSENSRNRVFIEQGEEVIINAFDPAKLADPTLIIYSPVKRYADKLIVTNGDQTDTISGYLKQGRTFEEALLTRQFEPDAPNLTPRISGILCFGAEDFAYKLSILKSADAAGSACSRYTFDYSAVAGLGHFLQTYNCDGNPIPTFTGEPERVAIPNSIDEFTEIIWNNLNEDNKVSLYVRFSDLDGGAYESRLINKNQ